MNGRVRPSIAVATLALALAACSASGSTAGPSRSASATPPPTTTQVPSPDPSPTPTAIPTTSGEGPVYVIGTQSYTRIGRGESTRVGSVMQLRGNSVGTVDQMNDPRVTGTGTVVGDADLYGAVGPQWGTYRLENADGAWEGPWTGMLWQSGAMTLVTAWLVGSGAYEGWTYYFHARGTGTVDVEGIIYAGPPPPAP